MNDLESMHQLIVQCAAAAELPVFPGAPELPEGRLVGWTGEPQAFVDLARNVGAALIYVEVDRYDPGELIDLIVRDRLGDDAIEAEEDEAGGDQALAARAEWVRERVAEAIAPWDQHGHQVRSVRAVWIREGVAHELYREVEWSDAHRAAVRGTLDEMEAVARGDRIARSRQKSQKLNELATLLALHPRFIEARSQERREYMAERLYGDVLYPADPLGIDVGSLVRRASLIHWWEVEPGEAASIAARVRSLREGGESILNIAAAVKISPAKVRAALKATR